MQAKRRLQTVPLTEMLCLSPYLSRFSALSQKTSFGLLLPTARIVGYMAYAAHSSQVRFKPCDLNSSHSESNAWRSLSGTKCLNF